jgi:hypothetical protein
MNFDFLVIKNLSTTVCSLEFNVVLTFSQKLINRFCCIFRFFISDSTLKPFESSHRKISQFFSKMFDLKLLNNFLMMKFHTDENLVGQDLCFLEVPIQKLGWCHRLKSKFVSTLSHLGCSFQLNFFRSNF